MTWVARTRSRRLSAAVHRDPFDRMLVAQALAEDLVLVTRDPLVHRSMTVATMPA